MATNAKKDKPKKVAIGDQILLDVARFDLKMGMAASLTEFQDEHSIKISALVTYGWLQRCGHFNDKYRLTDYGIAYLKRTFPKDDFERAVKHGQ